jgi:hypothetical protein
MRPGANLRSVLQLLASFAFSRSLPLFFFALPAPPVDLLSPLSRFLPPSPLWNAINDRRVTIVSNGP